MESQGGIPELKMTKGKLYRPTIKPGICGQGTSHQKEITFLNDVISINPILLGTYSGGNYCRFLVYIADVRIYVNYTTKKGLRS